MDRLERLYKISNRLNRGRPVSRSTLLNLIEPHGRTTLWRDIAYLIKNFNAPIEQNHDRSEYCLRSNEKIELPGIWFTPSEAHALMVFSHMLNEVQPGFLEQHLKPVQTRIEKALERGDSSLREVQRRIRVLTMASRQVEPRFFELISHAVIARRRVHIRYYNRQTSEHSTRDISPQRLVHYRDNWYLDGYCHWREALRIFALDCIEDLQLKPEAADEINDDELDAILGASYGIFAGAVQHHAVLRFTAHRAKWVAREQWHPKQQGQVNADGSYVLTVPYSDHRELLMDILKYGADVEVLEPKILRETVKDAIAHAWQHYR